MYNILINSSIIEILPKVRKNPNMLFIVIVWNKMKCKHRMIVITWNNIKGAINRNLLTMLATCTIIIFKIVDNSFDGVRNYYERLKSKRLPLVKVETPSNFTHTFPQRIIFNTDVLCFHSKLLRYCFSVQLKSCHHH